MEVFGYFVFPRFSGFFWVYSFIYRLFRAFLFTILFRHFVLPPIGILAFVLSCAKHEGGYTDEAVMSSINAEEIETEDVSYAATQNLPDRKFVKTAMVDMEVKDVYETTVAIENELKKIGGFITNSSIESEIISDKTYNTSNEDAVLIRKYQTYNRMTVRVPSQLLGEFLHTINQNKLFLNSQIINAEDVTNNAKIAEIQRQNNQKAAQMIDKMKNSGKKVELTKQNLDDDAQQQISQITLNDDLKYSEVSINLKEPKIRIAEIPVTNTQHIESKYQVNFWYDAQDSVISGFYFFQKVCIGLLYIWPLFIILAIIFYFVRRKRILASKKKSEN